MSILTSDGATLRAFTDAVLRAARETPDEVVPVALAVAGGVLCEADPGSVELLEGDWASVRLRAAFDGRRMEFRYNAMTAMIELRGDDPESHPERLFGRRSLQMDIVNFFGALRAGRRPTG